MPYQRLYIPPTREHAIQEAEYVVDRVCARHFPTGSVPLVLSNLALFVLFARELTCVSVEELHGVLARRVFFDEPRLTEGLIGIVIRHYPCIPDNLAPFASQLRQELTTMRLGYARRTVG